MVIIAPGNYYQKLCVTLDRTYHKKYSMKTQIFVFICSIYTLSAAAQQYVPFPMKDAFWNTYHQSFTSIATSIYTNGDTIIDNKKYAKLYGNSQTCMLWSPFSCWFSYGTSSYNFIREEDKRVYYKSTNRDEIVIYDFNLKVGDTLPHFYDEWNFPPECHYLITSIDSVKVNDGSFRKRYKAKSKNGFDFENEIIEGVGAKYMEKLIVPFTVYKTDSGHALGCFMVNNKPLFPIDASFCELVTNNHPIQIPELQVSSNILKNAIRITGEVEKMVDIKLYDRQGSLVLCDKGKPLPYLLEKGDLPVGLFFLHCSLDGGKSQVFKILVE